MNAAERHRLLRIAEMLRALSPFARMADVYETEDDDFPILAGARTGNPVMVTVGDLRAARAAMID